MKQPRSASSEVEVRLIVQINSYLTSISIAPPEMLDGHEFPHFHMNLRESTDVTRFGLTREMSDQRERVAPQLPIGGVGS